jgi:DNA-binding MarR family transcriptional regulator
MGSGLLVMSTLLLGLGTAGGDLAEDDPRLPGTQSDPAGSVLLGEQVRVAAELPVALPVDVDTSVELPFLPDLSVEVRSGPDDGDAVTTAAAPKPTPLRAVQDAPPRALLAGASLLATALALAAWLAKPTLGLFSRIEDGELAQHPLRRQALDYITANPGATLQDVRRSLGCAWGTAVYHLGRLERAGLVAVRHREGRRGHWPLGLAPAHDALAPTGESLARLVRERPGLPQNELARLAGIGPPAACKQLRRLESAGFVQAQRSGRARLYLPTASLDTVLAKAAAA